MDECERVSTAISVLISKLKHLSKVKYYDNRCNLYNSILFRFPWINEEIVISSDRFHYRSRKRNFVTNPDSYTICKDHRISGSDSINHNRILAEIVFD